MIRRIAVLGALMLSAACSGSPMDPVFNWQCSVVNEHGVVYTTQDISELAALEHAMNLCELDSSGPGLCDSRGCAPAQ